MNHGRTLADVSARDMATADKLTDDNRPEGRQVTEDIGELRFTHSTVDGCPRGACGDARRGGGARKQGQEEAARGAKPEHGEAHHANRDRVARVPHGS